MKAKDRKEMYGWVNETLRQQHYEQLGRRDKGVVRRDIGKMTGMSLAQTTRLISLYRDGEPVQCKPHRRYGFAARYTWADAQLLAEVDEAHETLSGPATKKILYRAHYDFREPGYERLANISVAHCTGCERHPAIGSAIWCINPRGQRRCRSERG